MFNANVIKTLVTCLFLGLLGGCIDNDADDPPPPTKPQPQYDFSAVDARFQQFLDESDLYDGVSYTVVDKEQGVVHEAALGDHTLDIVVMLASASKMPSASLLMALHDDKSLDFDAEATIDNYLPWEGVYGNRTTVQLLSNTSGIPGLSGLANYNVHLWCSFTRAMALEDCARLIYSNEIPGSVPPGTKFDYGGVQWQLAGGVAEQVTNSTWRQAFDKYIAEPCELEVMQFGNMTSIEDQWTGYPDSLQGLDNPLVEGGAISNMQDYAKLLLMHLRGGKCGDTQVLSEESVAAMLVDRSGGLEAGMGYGLGWWKLIPEAPLAGLDFGLFGSAGAVNVELGYGYYMAIDDYTNDDLESTPVPVTWLGEIGPLIKQAVDEARAAVGQ